MKSTTRIGMVFLAAGLPALCSCDRDEESCVPTDADAGADGYQWHAFFGGEGSSSVLEHGRDYGNSLAVDGSGNVYVTGVSTSPWDGPGGESPLNALTEGWEPEDGEGDGEQRTMDVFVLRLAASGAYGWHAFYGSSAYDEGTSLAVDGSGNIYVTGISLAPWNGPDGQAPLNGSAGIFVLKLDPGGAYLWHTFYPSTYFFDYSLAIDGSGNVYVAGTAAQSWDGPEGQSPLHALYADGDEYSADVNVFILKLDPGGAYQWHTFYRGTAYGTDHSLDVDGSGNVYVTGEADAPWNGPDGQSPLSDGGPVFALKLDASGAYQWHTFFGGGSSLPRSLGVDGSGNVYIAGDGGSWSGPDGQGPLNGDGWIFVLKLDPGGAYQWHTFHGTQSLSHSLTIDGSGNAYVTGFALQSWDGPDGQSPLHAHSGADEFNVFLLQLDSSGAYGWHGFYGGNGSNNHGSSVGVDASGDIYVTGESDSSWSGPGCESPLNRFSGYTDAFVLKLTK